MADVKMTDAEAEEFMCAAEVDSDVFLEAKCGEGESRRYASKGDFFEYVRKGLEERAALEGKRDRARRLILQF